MVTESKIVPTQEANSPLAYNMAKKRLSLLFLDSPAGIQLVFKYVIFPVVFSQDFQS